MTFNLEEEPVVTAARPCVSYLVGPISGRPVDSV